MPDPDRFTRLLARAQGGDRSVLDRLVAQVYEELHGIAEAHTQRERSPHALQPTALVNEAYLRLVDQRKTDWKSRTHFLAIASKQMFRVLADHARARGTAKRGGDIPRVTLHDARVPSSEAISEPRDVDVLDLEEALAELSALDPRGCRVVQCRYFAGMTVKEIAEFLGVSERTVAGDWRTARAWLHGRLRSLSPDSADVPTP